jgi:hypothetical protein
LYWKGDGGVCDAYPEGSNDNDLPVFVYDPKGTTSFKLARASPVLLCPWTQVYPVCMGTGYHAASKRWYGIAKGTYGPLVSWLDTTNWETNPNSLAWQTLDIDLRVGAPNNLTGNGNHAAMLYGPLNTPIFMDDTAKVAYFFDVGVNPAILALTLPGHPQGEHRVLQVVDMKATIFYDIAQQFGGLTNVTISPFVWIPEHRCIVWMQEPGEENVGPWTLSMQIDVDTGVVTEGPRYPNSDEDGMPYHPNCGVWFPPTGELILFGLSIMSHAILHGNRGWDANPNDPSVPKVWNRYKWVA